MKQWIILKRLKIALRVIFNYRALKLGLYKCGYSRKLLVIFCFIACKFVEAYQVN